MAKRNGSIVNEIIAVNCIFEGFLKGAHSDVSRSNKVAAEQPHSDCHKCIVLVPRGVLQKKGEAIVVAVPS